ncbi:MAG: DUF4249 domain-containing protein [Rhodothermia bacterium]|nr:MAG: DUF4249 domain-containing protein [Rhodothermia bacterium]
MMRLAFFITLFALLVAACDTTTSSDHEDEVVVESYLVAGEAIPVVRLTLTTEITGRYDASELAIRNASVSISLLAGAGGGRSNGSESVDSELEIAYVHDENRPGIYQPVDSHTILPERTYALLATVPGYGNITAETIVPGTFSVRSVSATSVQYQGPIRFEQNVTASAYPGRQSIFIFSLEALEPSIASLTPLYLDAIYEISAGEEFDPNSLDVEKLGEFLQHPSPPINEGNYEVNPDGTLTIRLPWFAIVFYGQTRVHTNAIDDALFDFLRYQQVQQGGSTLSPGEIPNVLDHVEGGRGIFGSYSHVSSVVEVLR